MDTTTALAHARALDLPTRDEMLRRDPSVQRFWAAHRDLLQRAWTEWDAGAMRSPALLDGSLIDADLRRAVDAAWQDPTTEGSVRDLLHERAPGVFSFQLFDPDRLSVLRDYLEEVWDAGIPLRPPYGIVLNRRGAMLDTRSDGALAAPTFQAFYRDVLDTYMRPIARLLFPEILGYDSQTFGFSINYKPETDTSIQPHTDASAVTLNINVNLPGEAFTGSSVDFYGDRQGEVTPLSFEPGMAMIHRGRAPHAAQPITSGERTNLVLWLFGERGQVPQLHLPAASVTAAERWTRSTVAQDGYAPF